ncbi:extracellular solute-binding protein [Streptomyces radicis]|uniref:Extracellular solute-binding protein n=1 Tax=Streptomyces radicis TaxID=1750517 RepID=A0A3A9WIA6_9ACTN|nr:extracellular solute-binding protein [Streptomyces radicis]RKN12043.1 extracellular solute-binding protein [Streptomyces radicis]RKN25906.1 extracellular solute-binding protein [Streptomyces radicis]
MNPSSLSPPGPSRRALLGAFAGAGALAAVGAAGCAAPSTGGAGRTRLRYWHLFGGGDGVNMAAMLDAFRAEHPDIHLEDATLEWGAPYYTKLGMAGAGGRAPEVAVLHMARLTGFAPGRLLNPFDLDLLAEHGVTPADFPENLWTRGAVEGRQYAVPLDTHPIVLYYNTDICERAGLLDGEGRIRPIEGREAFTEAIRAAGEVTGQPGLVIETLGADTVGPWRVFSTFYAQAGGTLLSADGSEITIDEPKMLDVLTYLRMLADEGLIVPRVDYQGTVGVFSAGETGLFLNGEWEVSTFTNTGLPFSMARVPNVFGSGAAQADCHSFVLPNQDGRGGATNEAAHAFVAWMLRNSVDWASGGHVPAYLPTLDEPDYLAMRPQSEYRGVIDEVALDPPAWFAGSASSMWLELGAVFSGVLIGTRTPRDAVDEARSRLEDLLQTPNPFGESA